MLKGWTRIEELEDTRISREGKRSVPVPPTARHWAGRFVESLARSQSRPVICLTDPLEPQFVSHPHLVAPFFAGRWEEEITHLIRNAVAIVALDFGLSGRTTPSFHRELDWIAAFGRQSSTLLVRFLPDIASRATPFAYASEPLGLLQGDTDFERY